ncbi:MAG TPA: hypothetical protein VK879_09200 [Candidatus Sulfomarinibacteraceae bacterium]|nr:hypothetical protein [Candidatus Sulfomarinibacteraceae bacterium]
MAERISGKGEIRRGETTVCQVTYQLNLPEEGEAQFTLTDGVIEIELPEGSDAVTDLQPNEQVTLHLQAPLSDGTDTLPLIIEPYEGHRPDERYQVRVVEG